MQCGVFTNQGRLQFMSQTNDRKITINVEKKTILSVSCSKCLWVHTGEAENI